MTAKPLEQFVYYVEVSGHCNLRCPSCPNGNYAGSQPKGYMEPDLFQAILKKITAESPGRDTVLYLLNWGEPTLHPELPRLIEMARRSGMRPHLSSNLAAPKNLRDIVKAGPASLRVSISGYFPETYARTHAPGDVWMVKSNVYRLRSFMDALNADFPASFFYHKYRHNLGADFKKIAELAGEVRFPLTALWAQYFPVEKLLDYYEGHPDPKDKALLDLLAVIPEEFRQVSLAHRPSYPDCVLRAQQMCIDFDGAVSLCCASYDRKHFLEGAFLDCRHDDLQAQKYRHPLCRQCQAHGCDITYIYGGLEELNEFALKRI